MKPLLALLFACAALPAPASDLSKRFATPPDTARPWVYWFWNNGNVTDAGIKADLEAMQRVGVGGVIIMDVLERFAPPRGTADFMNAEWRKHFAFAAAEAKRLGLEINMTNGPGWCGSSGPWITPELSMQMLVASSSVVEGPTHVSEMPSQPARTDRQRDGWDSKVMVGDYYRDVVVLAYPQLPNGSLSPQQVIDLTSKVDANGKLNWDAPAGKWVIQRIGHTSTGSSTRPPVAGGNGLECDKLSRTAMDVHFAAMLAKLIADAGPENSKAITTTHIDSWEVGAQNWTELLRDEFKRRRGYDLTPYLPNLLSNQPTVGDKATADRFAWDFKQTLSELLAQNYSGRLAELAHQHGMRLSMEGYELPFGDEATYTAAADEPMTEFWASPSYLSNDLDRRALRMTSVGHIYGRPIVGAEAFTSGDDEKWLLHPALIKSLGDYEFCQGVNRFVVHRFAHQPYLDREPGATMGPWGLHYERTQTWWEMSGAWHTYLARCQEMLREGKFVADICYLRPELPDQGVFNPTPAVPAGYRYDECSAQALISRMSVKDGRLVLPDGMSYQVLVLPPTSTMTPALARKIKQLVNDGATVIATSPRPVSSPSLADLAKGDAEVDRLTTELWGTTDGHVVTEHKLGAGQLLWGQTLEGVLKTPDLRTSRNLNWIHRRTRDEDIYFLANPANGSVETNCTFRVGNRQPELWDPITGKITSLATFKVVGSGISAPLRFDASGSMFVVFRRGNQPKASVTSFTRDGAPVYPTAEPSRVTVTKAIYGVPGDEKRSRDMRDRIQRLLDGGITEFEVGSLAEGDDPAYGIVKTLDVEFTMDGKLSHLKGQDPNRVSFGSYRSAPERSAEVEANPSGDLRLLVWKPGQYQVLTSKGMAITAAVSQVPSPVSLDGPWNVAFPPKWGAPGNITLDPLVSLSESTDSGVAHFSGTATYTKDFEWQSDTKSARQFLDLGDVQVMAHVKLNGKDLGILWRSPYSIEVTNALRPGTNHLEIQVANLWPNRMIADAALPAAQRLTWSSWEPFGKDTPLVKSGLVGPVTLKSATVVPLKNK